MGLVQPQRTRRIAGVHAQADGVATTPGIDAEGMAQVLVYCAWMLIRIGRFEEAGRALTTSSTTISNTISM